MTIGVAWLASNGSIASLLRRAGDPAAVMGLIAGLFFALAAVFIRAASRTMGDAPAFDRALVTLMAMLTIQTAINTVGFAVIDPSSLPEGDQGVATGGVRRAVQPARVDRMGVGDSRWRTPPRCARSARSS